MEKFVANPAVWSVFIAAVALIASLFRPVRDLVNGVQLKIKPLPRFFQLSHFLGNIQMALYLGVQNLGGKSAEVAEIDFIMMDSRGDRWELPARTYFARQPATPKFLIGSISLKPGELLGRNSTLL